MHYFLSILFLAGILSGPVSAHAQSAHAWSYMDVDVDRYEDAPWDRPTAVAVSALTRLGAVTGNPDGTYRPENTLNRAEFMTIAMRLLPGESGNRRNCFPDVAADAWYAAAVCRAKELGIVQGNAMPGQPASEWRFEPASDVQYEEAVKVLARIFALPIVGDTNGMDWYVPYLRAASDAEIGIDALNPGDRITRGEMARIAIAFYAHAHEELPMLREAQAGARSSSSVRSSMHSSESSSWSSISSRWSSSSMSRDPDSDLEVESSLLVLGDTSPILAVVDVRSSLEPLDVRDITVEFTQSVDSIETLTIYDESGQWIASAAPSGSTTFHASLDTGNWMLDKGEERSFYIRANVKDDAEGGVSGETVRVYRVTVDGTGVWSNEPYTTVSTDDFYPSETARAGITAVTQIGDEEAALFSQDMSLLGSFRFRSQSTGFYDPQITQLRFRIEKNGGVTLSDAHLRTDAGVESPCTISAAIMTCSSIPSSIGTVRGEKLIRVYADVDVPAASDNAMLRITLQDPGYPSQAGDITWTDGVTTFTWVDLDAPLARGTLFRR